MKHKITTITPNGQITVTESTGEINLEQLQTLVGGNIETVPHLTLYASEPCWAICDEEGLLKNLPLNMKLAELGYSIVGPVVILQGDAEFMASL